VPERTGSERTDVDRATFERAAFDRAAFDRAGIRPAGPGRGGSERVESDTAAFERAPVDDGADVRSLIPGPRMPLPAETEGLAAGKPPERGAPSWTGWWAGTDPNRPGPAGADGTTATIATPAGSAEPADGGAPDDDAPAAARPSLRRRVPQAHLAPGLRIVPPGAEPVDPAPLPVAAEALSRYQASRAAARSAVDGQVANEAADERSAR
jgi:hypothetical protein